VGSLVGAILLIPWIQYVLSGPPELGAPKDYNALFELRYWLLWIGDAFGISVSFSLGREGFMRFLEFPSSTYLMGISHLLVLLLGIFGSFLVVKSFFRSKPSLLSTDDTGLAVRSTFWGNGLLLSLAGKPIHRHYMLITFPLEWVSIASLALKRIASPLNERLLFALWILQFSLAAGYLSFIHQNHGMVGADYGLAYQYQQH
jgi:hypothetical protein